MPRHLTRAPTLLCLSATLLGIVVFGLLSNITYTLFVLPGRNHSHRLELDLSVGSIAWGEERPHWAQYTPFASVEQYKTWPSNCEITQVNLLERHGARYPTSGAGLRIKAALEKVQAACHDILTSSELGFLSTYTYQLGTADLLPAGSLQSHNHGAVDFVRYQSLFKGGKLPFVRASDSQRVIDSAVSWTKGFAQASGQRFQPPLSVIMSEAPESNNTLDDNACLLFQKSTREQQTWLSIFAPPIRERLSKDLDVHAGSRPSSPSLTDADIPALMSLCPFDSLAQGQRSPWCDLFTEDELDSFDYYHALGKYYGTGYGYSLGPVQGLGYINELLARLTNTLVNDTTQTNSTLLSSPETFPFDRPFYADFTHDNQMIAIYSAMGLFNITPPLDPHTKTRPAGARDSGWVMRDMVPFSGRMVVERLACGGSVDKEARKEYVRVLVNDRVMPLDFCGTRDGLCELADFVESQGYARRGGDGDWRRCFES